MTNQYTIKDLLNVINHAMTESCDASGFLNVWSDCDWDTMERDFPEYKIPAHFKNDIDESDNTTVTVVFSNGKSCKFSASNDLEELIEAGEMFSISTVHPGYIGEWEHASVFKMYAGNPISALGHMLLMRSNAEDLGTEHQEVIVAVLNSCITFLSNEITSHQSGTVSNDEGREGRENCPAIDSHCDFFSYQSDDNGDVCTSFCDHPDNPDNPDESEGNCTRLLCPDKDKVPAIDPRDCPVTGEHCDHYAYKLTDSGELESCVCEEPDNSDNGKCVSESCPISPDYIPF